MHDSPSERPGFIVASVVLIVALLGVSLYFLLYRSNNLRADLPMEVVEKKETSDQPSSLRGGIGTLIQASDSAHVPETFAGWQSSISSLYARQKEEGILFPSTNEANTATSEAPRATTVTRRAPLRCRYRSRSITSNIPSRKKFCSDVGFVTPGIADGDCPLSACVLLWGDDEKSDAFIEW